MLYLKPTSGRHRTLGALAAVLLETAMTPIAVAQSGNSPAHARHQPVPDLPLAISSFGAAVQGGSLYVYGGHIGRQHVHSFENLSQLFLRYPLAPEPSGPSPGWLALPPGPPLQGTALVEYGRAIYRVGGMRANNPRREPSELYSVRSAARFLPAENRWERLPELPAGRSSHGLAIVGDQLVVAGGWELRGSVEDPLWERTVMALDLRKLDSDAGGEWNELTETPVGVRANAAVGLNGKWPTSRHLYATRPDRSRSSPTRTSRTICSRTWRTWSSTSPVSTWRETPPDWVSTDSTSAASAATAS